MYFEDARELTLPALLLLVSQREALGCPDLQVSSLVDFSTYARTHELTRRQKEVIVDQASFLIGQFYAHLPFKRARYAADPVQSLRLIRAQLDSLNDLAFHEHMLQTMVSLRDAHTFYALPFPIRVHSPFCPSKCAASMRNQAGGATLSLMFCPASSTIYLLWMRKSHPGMASRLNWR